jgi:Zn-dependent protease/CBS domain-containing protein
MFGRGFKLFTLFGFEIRADLSWVLLAVLVTWSLARGAFPHFLPDLSESAYWWMGAVSAAGLFASVIFHELFHSLAARRFGMTIRGITLFIFGGVAEMGEEPPSAKAEFVMAFAGPASSLFLSAFFFAITLAASGLGSPATVTGVLSYLAVINLLLAAFNLLPAFPLDGGRVLRSILWHFKGDLLWATQIASVLGSGFGFLLISYGVVQFLFASFFAGLWWLLIGIFLRNASRRALDNVVSRRALEGIPVRRFMTADPVPVEHDTTIRTWVEEVVYRRHHKMYPVTRDGSLEGCVTTRDLEAVPLEEWESRAVGSLASPCSAENAIDADAPALEALQVMVRTGNSRLMVLDGGALAGVIALKDLLQFVSLKFQLES